MKVFINKRTGGYRGGLAVVAANTPEEAHKTFFSNPDYEYLCNKWDENFNYTDDITEWETFEYHLNDWKECKFLTASVNKPCIIAEGGYTE